MSYSVMVVPRVQDKGLLVALTLQVSVVSVAFVLNCTWSFQKNLWWSVSLACKIFAISLKGSVTDAAHSCLGSNANSLKVLKSLSGWISLPCRAVVRYTRRAATSKRTSAHTPVRSLTSVHGQTATGALHAATSWHAITASILDTSRSSAITAAVGSRGPTTSRCTWSGIPMQTDPHHHHRPTWSTLTMVWVGGKRLRRPSTLCLSESSDTNTWWKCSSLQPIGQLKSKYVEHFKHWEPLSSSVVWMKRTSIRQKDYLLFSISLSLLHFCSHLHQNVQKLYSAAYIKTLCTCKKEVYGELL